MPEFEIYVQEKYYKTVTAANTGEALKIVSTDIENGGIPGFNPAAAHNIRIERKV